MSEWSDDKRSGCVVQSTRPPCFYLCWEWDVLRKPTSGRVVTTVANMSSATIFENRGQVIKALKDMFPPNQELFRKLAPLEIWEISYGKTKSLGKVGGADDKTDANTYDGSKP